jgi:hypothetical protein
MKPVIFFTVFFAAFLGACEKSADSSIHDSLVGKWKLVEHLADPGDGSGVWQKADPLNPSYAVFKQDGTIDAVGWSPRFSKYSVTNIEKFSLIDTVNQDSMHFRYSITPALLTIYPPCIEACGQRYIRVED